MQKARRHHTRWLRPLVGAWFQELFHSPRRGAFHLSLTVLVHYRSHGSIQPCRMVPADSHRVSRAPRYSGYRMPPRLFGYGAVILCGATFQTLPLETRQHDRGPTTPAPRQSHARRFGLVPVRSPLLGESLLFSSPGGTKMFQFPPFASHGQMPGMTALQAAGLSHSETRGSKVICTSPRLIAAYRVLHRLREPRHPPCALSYFSYRHARHAAGAAHTFSWTSRAQNEPGVLVIVISTTVLLVQHVKDRVRQAGERCRPSCSAEWRITDSNR